MWGESNAFPGSAHGWWWRSAHSLLTREKRAQKELKSEVVGVRLMKPGQQEQLG